MRSLKVLGILILFAACAHAAQRPDTNGDGKTDIPWRSYDTGYTRLWLMNGSVTTTSAALINDPSWSITHTGDFDNDGKSDFVWRNSQNGATAIWLMNGTAPMIGSNQILYIADWTVTHVGDFNGDGKTDLIWRNQSTGATHVWLMSGTSILAASELLSLPQGMIVATGDFNGDGKTDLIWHNASTGETAIWLMNGTTMLSSAIVVANTQWTVVKIGDLNGDGKSDLLWRNSVTGEHRGWIMNGLSFSGQGNINSNASQSATNLIDLDGDGKTDILWRDSSTGYVVGWLMNGLSSVASSTIRTDPDWYVEGVGDFNGDQKADLIWTNLATANTEMWLMSGLSVLSNTLISSDPSWLATTLDTIPDQLNGSSDSLVSDAPCQAALGTTCTTNLSWTYTSPVACLWHENGRRSACHGGGTGTASWGWTNSSKPDNFVIRRHRGFGNTGRNDPISARSSVVAIAPGYGTLDEYESTRQSERAFKINNEVAYSTFVSIPSIETEILWTEYERMSVRQCSNGEKWKWIDAYAPTPRAQPGGASYPVNYTKVLIDGVDVTAQMQQDCGGSSGQPYARFNVSPGSYRIQVWGGIADAPGLPFSKAYYWDAVLSYVASVTNNCWTGTGSSKTRQGFKTVEAWWDQGGGWMAPSNGSMGSDGKPTGANVTYAREVVNGRAAGILWQYLDYGSQYTTCLTRVERRY